MKSALKVYEEASSALNTSMRNLFDYGSAEYHGKDDAYRLAKLKKIFASGYNLHRIIEGYRQYYIRESKRHVVDAIPRSLIFLLEELAKEYVIAADDLKFIADETYDALVTPGKIDVNRLVSIITQTITMKKVQTS